MNDSSDSYPRVGPLALSRDDLRRLAPSVFAEAAQPGVSRRYAFVATSDIVDLLEDEGWVPVRARQQHVRLAARQGFQMHEIRFARRDDLLHQPIEVGGTRPELVLQNAHDGSRAYRIDAGLYRLVCRNGLVVADAAFAHVAIRHVDILPEKFTEAAQAVATGAPTVLETVRRWQARPMMEPARVELARRAALLRWDATQPVSQLLSARQLLAPLRYGDHASDLWTTFNVIQEHLVRGGDRYAGIAALESGTRFMRNRTRPMAGLQESQTLNKELWNLAEEFAQN